MMLSASVGMPSRPSRAANAPSFITPSPTRLGSSVWWTTTASKSGAWGKTRRMPWALITLRAPSVKATAPEARSRPISAISCPPSPLVSAAIGWTCTIAVSRARRSTKSTIAGSSMTGLVSGWQTIVVTPPAAAARLAVASVSRCSAPRSPTKARMSMTRPRQSIVSVPSGTPEARMPRRASRIRPSTISTSPGSSRSREGSTIRALASRIGRGSASIGSSHVGQVARKRFEHCHPHRDAHFHLLADQGLRAVGDARIDLDPAIHRAWVHDQRVGLGVAELLLVEPVVVEIFLDRGHERAVHALALQAEHHDDIGIRETLAHVAADFDA